MLTEFRPALVGFQPQVDGVTVSISPRAYAAYLGKSQGSGPVPSVR